MVVTARDRRSYTCYAIQCDINKKVYIGMSYNLENRLYSHFLQLKKGTHKAPGLQEDFDRYGVEAFTVYKLEENVGWQNAGEVEMKYTKMYQSYDRSFGYNKQTKTVDAALYGKFKKKDGMPPMLKGV